MIRNIVFDMGKVMIQFDPDRFMDRAGIEDPADRKLILNSGDGKLLSIQLSETAGSFIVYVNAPGSRQESLSCRVFNLKK